MTDRNKRADHARGHRKEYERQRKKLITYGKANDIPCAICGLPIDYKLKHPDPMSVSVDHIVPIAKGGDVADSDNLQLTHFKCNVMKSDKLTTKETAKEKMNSKEKIGNRMLPLSMDWSKF